MNKLMVFILAFLMPIAVSAQLYGDLTFDIKDNGLVHMSGNTNYDVFKGTTENMTSKEGSLWSVTITSPVFEEYIYKVRLPKYSVISYIKANTPVRIEESSGSIIITATGSKKPIDINVQYSISSRKKTLWLARAGAIVALIIIALVLDSYVIRRANRINKKKIKRELYTERQLLILDYLQKHGHVTQAELEKNLMIPKASLSRNIKTLSQKGIIFSETRGMSNIVGIK